jgi:anti-sigma regulatory factor (Ser/Thr protein kinase)
MVKSLYNLPNEKRGDKMARTMSNRPDPKAVRRFIFEKLNDHPNDIVRITSEEFKISRQAAHAHVAKLVKEGFILPEGNTNKRRYMMKPTVITHEIQFEQCNDEDIVWRQFVGPLLSSLSENVQIICYHGFTEIFNNAIDHSEAKSALINIVHTQTDITITIQDNGVGIFEKIRSQFALEDQRQAILELSKGKLTTDPTRHSGEGIYFTSRMFDKFAILSNYIYFLHESDNEDWAIENRSENVKGTTVIMKIDTNSSRTTQQVYDKFISETDEDDYAFSRTHVPLSLAILGNENLISRSQAKRVLRRFDRFREVLLDFAGIDSIGQAFADEIFRVFYIANPNIKVFAINDNAQVRRMIRRAILARTDRPKSPPTPLSPETQRKGNNRRQKPAAEPGDSD